MRKATIILRLIDDLERELYSNFTDEQIQNAIKIESKRKPFLYTSDGLINAINTATME